MINRTSTVYHGMEIIEQNTLDITWDELRSVRDDELKKTDWRFVSDQYPSDEWIAYRAFLRDLPQNFPDSANDAADAWNEYEKPE